MRVYYLYLDDVRTMPDKFDKCIRNYKDFVKFVKAQKSSISMWYISFDHDLGEGLSGYDCAKFLVNWCIDNGYKVPTYEIHSANPVGRENIRSIFETYNKLYGEVDDTIS